MPHGAICTVFSLMSDRPDKNQLRDGIWEYLEQHDPKTFRRVKKSLLGRAVSLKGKVGEKAIISVYRLARKIFKFN